MVAGKNVLPVGKILSSKGQLVLPASYRRKMGLKAGSAVEIREEGGRLILEPADGERAGLVKVPGIEHPILSVRRGVIADADLVDPLDDDA